MTDKPTGYFTGTTKFRTFKGLVRRCIKAGALDAGLNAAGNFAVRWPELDAPTVYLTHDAKRGWKEIDIQLHFDLKE